MIKSSKHGHSSALSAWVGLLIVGAAAGVSPRLGYADIGPADSIVKTPEDRAFDFSLRSLREAYEFIRGDAQIGALLKNEARHALSAIQRVASSDLETIKFQHYYRGLEVVGSQAMRQRGHKGVEILNRLAVFDLESSPTLSEADAVAIAKAQALNQDITAAPQLKIFPGSEESKATLVYWVDMAAEGLDPAREIIIDAHSGAVIGNLPKDLTIAPIRVVSAKDQGVALIPHEAKDQSGQPVLQNCEIKNLATGKSETISAAECNKMSLEKLNAQGGKCQIVVVDSPYQVTPDTCANGPADDASVARARENSTAVLNYFLGHHERNSYDNKGAAAVNVVHAGLKYNNAHWSTSQNIMVYGDGDPDTGLGDFTLAMDVAGHEMTHGVVSQTAKFTNMSEAGALNEATADYFGIQVVGGRDWQIGKKLFLDQSKGDAIRNLQNPAALSFGPKGAKRPYPMHFRDLVKATGACDGTNDMCYVHINATIPGHASYLVTQAIGAAKAEHLYYVALTQGWTARDTISSAAATVKKTCEKIYEAATCASVNQAFAQVGL